MAKIIMVTCGCKMVDDKGKVIDYIPSYTTEGRCYKDDDAFVSGEGVCYIPEYAFDDELNIKDTYTRDDIVSVCDGDDAMADMVYFSLSWEYPETRYEDIKFCF
jgi:hypothetical protein